MYVMMWSAYLMSNSSGNSCSTIGSIIVVRTAMCQNHLVTGCALLLHYSIIGFVFYFVNCTPDLYRRNRPRIAGRMWE